LTVARISPSITDPVLLTAFEIMLVELVEEGPQMFARDAVQHAALRGAPNIGSREIGPGWGGVKLHDLGRPLAWKRTRGARYRSEAR